MFITNLARLIRVLILVSTFLVVVFYRPAKGPLINFLGTKTFIGVVNDYPDQRIDHVKLNISNISMDGLFLDGSILVSTSLYPKYQYGDLLEVTCFLKRPSNFEDFAYIDYLERRNIYLLCNYPKIRVVGRHQGNFFKEKIFNFKDEIRALVNKNLPEPQASIFSAMILGLKKQIPNEIINQFNKTGTSHILAISGLHITIILTIFTNSLLGLYFSRKGVFIMVVIFLSFFLTMIGFPASALRASTMSLMICAALIFGRLNNAYNSIVLAACLMILFNPAIIYEVSFQLSFVATLGIIFFSPYFNRLLFFISDFLSLRSSLAVSLSAYIATLPFIIFHFKMISLVAPIVNILVVPAIFFIIIFGLISILFSFLLSGFSLYFFMPVWILVSYISLVINYFSSLPYAFLNL